MNNITILVLAFIISIISYLETFNNEDIALFVLSMFIIIPAIVVSFVGIITGRNIFEC